MTPAPGGPAPRPGARGPLRQERGTRPMPDRPRLAATNRTVIGKKVSHLRREGRLPAVVYGHGVASESVSVDAHEFELLKRKVGASTLVDLAVDGGRTRPVLLHAIQVHPITRRRRLALFGPAFVAAIAYVDPGNFATNVSAGARFGYLLLWVIVSANLMAMLVQSLSAKLGLATGM